MSDNLRPMLYRRALRSACGGSLRRHDRCVLAGKHCESGDVIVKDALLDDPRPGDVIVTPATGAYGFAMAPTTTASACAGRLLSRRRRARGRAARELRGADGARCPLNPSGRSARPRERSGRRSPSCWASAPGRSSASTAARRLISGVLTRTRGNFEEIIDGAELIVEVMAGSSQRANICWRRCGPARMWSAPTSSYCLSTAEELFGVAREHGVRLRFEAAVAAPVPVVRLLEESLAATPIERIHGIVNGTTNFILSEMPRAAPTRRRSPRLSAWAMRGGSQRRRQRS